MELQNNDKMNAQIATTRSPSNWFVNAIFDGWGGKKHIDEFLKKGIWEFRGKNNTFEKKYYPYAPVIGL